MGKYLSSQILSPQAIGNLGTTQRKELIPIDTLLDLEVYRLLRRAHIDTRRVIHARFGEYGLTGAQYWVLARTPADGIPLTALAAQANADPANISGIVDRLVREGLLRRQPDPGDRRVSLICLTEEGRARLEAVTPHYQEAVIGTLSGLDPAQKEQLRTLLRLLVGEPQADLARFEANRLVQIAQDGSGATAQAAAQDE